MEQRSVDPNRSAEAMEVLWESVRLQPDDPARHEHLANLLLQAERFADAEAVLLEGIKLHDGCIALHDLLSVPLERQMRHAEAAAAIRRATELDPNDADRFGRLGALSLAAEQYSEAEAACRRAISLREDDAGFHYVLAIALQRQHRSEEALVPARRSVELAPENPDLNANLGGILQGLKHFPEAEKALTIAVRARPENIALRNLLDYVLQQLNRLEEVIEHGRKDVELEPEHVGRNLRLADLLIRAKQPADAALALKEAIRRNGTVPALHETLSRVLETLGRTEEAAAAMREAVELDSDNHDMRTRLSDLLGRLGHMEEAEHVLASTAGTGRSSAGRLAEPEPRSSTAVSGTAPMPPDGRSSGGRPRVSAVALVPQDGSRLAIIGAAEQVAGISARELVMKFESLGCDCEVGFIQRLSNAEPLSLMRFSFMSLGHIIRGIQTDFAGLVENLDAFQRRADQEWELCEPTYKLFSHTFRAGSSIDKETLLVQQRRRIGYLRDKLLADLAEAEKIFVVWRTETNITEEEVTQLWDAMRARGPGRLLWVVKDEPAGEVREVRPGLMRGTIDRWRDDQFVPEFDRVFSFRGWLTVLVNSWLLCRESGTVDPNRKYVLFVTKDVGLGHLLGAILNSAYYAWRTGRALALDMREFHYVSGNKHTGFFEHFSLELPRDLEVITDLDVIDRLRQDEDLHFLRLDTERLDVDQPFAERVLLIPCLVPGEPYPISAKRKDMPFRINLRGRLLEAWQEVMRRPEWSGPVIGLHYRSTVGEVTERMTKAITPDYEERYRAVKDNYIATALAVAAQAGYANPAFLVTSDDMDFVTYVRQRLPNAFSLATRLPDQEWAAWVRAHGHDFSIMSEAVNDLWCLSACDHLVHFRSGFSHFAILNSAKLDETTAHYVHVPALKEILDSLGPQEAVVWARGAVRKAGIRRLQQRYLFDWLADTLDRVGEAEAAARERQRAQWHWECHFSPVMDNPDRLQVEERARRGDFTGVVDRALRAAREHPDNPFWLSGYGYSLSNVLAQTGRFEDAIVPARRALEIEPEDPFLHEQLGVVLTRAGKLEEGEQEIRQAIAIDAEIGRFHTTLGDNLMRQRHNADAIAAFREAARVEPDDPHLTRRLGIALLQVGDNAGAEAAFRQALTLREEAGPHIEIGDALVRQGRLADALGEIQAAVALEPSNPHWHIRMAHVLLQSDRPAEAEAAARMAIQYAPYNSAFHDTLVKALQRQGREEEAVAEIERAANRSPQDAPTRVRLARTMLEADRLTEAEVELRNAAESQPDLVDVHDLLSVVLERQGRRTQAAAAAQRAAELMPEDLSRRHRVAMVLMEARDLDGAERVLREADRLATSAGTFHHHHLLSIVFQRQDRLEEAVVEARKASEAEPENPDLLARVATLLSWAKKFDEAEVVARRALSLRPDDELLHRLLATILQERPEPVQSSQEPATTDLVAAPPPAQHPEGAEPAEKPLKTGHRWQVRHWRTGLSSSLRHLLTGNPK
jgi:Flp pilus assembly protein TadD